MMHRVKRMMVSTYMMMMYRVERMVKMATTYSKEPLLKISIVDNKCLKSQIDVELSNVFEGFINKY